MVRIEAARSLMILNERGGATEERIVELLERVRDTVDENDMVTECCECEVERIRARSFRGRNGESEVYAPPC
jgi:UDP-N-acetylenolpyruvoylglucosamine reductase